MLFYVLTYSSFMRGDILKRSIVTATGIAILAYLFWLYNNGAIIVQGEFVDYNVAAYGILSLLCVFYLVAYGIYPIHIKWHKRMFLVIGIGVIIGSYTYLLDDASQNIYIGDFMKLLGVLLVLFGATGHLIPAKSHQKKAESEIEIIEV